MRSELGLLFHELEVSEGQEVRIGEGPAVVEEDLLKIVQQIERRGLTLIFEGTEEVLLKQHSDCIPIEVYLLELIVSIDGLCGVIDLFIVQLMQMQEHVRELFVQVVLDVLKKGFMPNLVPFEMRFFVQ